MHGLEVAEFTSNINAHMLLMIDPFHTWEPTLRSQLNFQGELICELERIRSNYWKKWKVILIENQPVASNILLCLTENLITHVVGYSDTAYSDAFGMSQMISLLFC